MVLNEIFEDKKKCIERYVKPLIYNINPIFVNAEYKQRYDKSCFAYLTLGDGTHRVIEDYDYTKLILIQAILDEVGEYC